MSNPRFDNIESFEGVVFVEAVDSTPSEVPAWEIPAETIEENRAIDNNMKLLDLNVARSAALVR